MEQFSDLKEETIDLNLMNGMIKASVERNKNPEGNAPNPSIEEFCFLQKNTDLLSAEITAQIKKDKTESFCQYMATLALWKIAAISQKDYLNPKFGGEKISAKKNELMKQALDLCQRPGTQEKFAKGFGLNREIFLEKLSCKITIDKTRGNF